MFEGRRARRSRAKERAKADAILANAKTAAEAARRALRQAQGSNREDRPREDQLGDAIQAAILGSVVPSVVDAVHVRDPAPFHRRPAQGGGALFLAGLAAGIGLAAWARREPQAASSLGEDDEWELAGGANARAAKEAINTTLDRLDLALRRAVKAAAEGMGSTANVFANATAPTAEKVTGQIKVARKRAAAEVIRALDDVDDVWEDDVDDVVAPAPSGARPKKPVARRPVEGKPAASGENTKKAPPRKRKDAD